MNKKIIKIISIIIITLFFLYTTKIKENLITWYLFFYNIGANELTSNTPKYLTSNLEYNYYKYDYIDELTLYIQRKTRSNTINTYYKFLFSNILKSFKLKKLKIVYLDSPIDLLKNVSNDKNNLGIITSPLLAQEVSKDTDLIKNINFVIVSNYQFVFFLVHKQSGISKLSEINGKVINLGLPYSDEKNIGEDIINTLLLKTNGEPKELTNYDIDTAFDKLKTREIDGMFLCDLYPSDILNKLLLDDLEKNFILIPIEGLNQDIIRETNPFLEEVQLDLNYLPENYLPVKIKDLEFTVYRPDMTSYRYATFFICNKNAVPDTTFGLVNSIVSNLDVLNQSKFYLKNPWNYLSFPGIANSQFIPIHVGAKVYYNKLSVVTTNPNDFCRYFVGKAECTQERITGAKIVTGIR